MKDAISELLHKYLRENRKRNTGAMKKLLTYLIYSIYKARTRYLAKFHEYQLNPFHANTQLTGIPMSVSQRACTHDVNARVLYAQPER